MYIEGTGHTKGEGCEHIFSLSNELAHSTHHATPFHQHQMIEQYFAFGMMTSTQCLVSYVRCFTNPKLMS